MHKTSIFAKVSRQYVLREAGIPFSVDQDLNFVFLTEKEKDKAIAVLDAACEL